MLLLLPLQHSATPVAGGRNAPMTSFKFMHDPYCSISCCCCCDHSSCFINKAIYSIKFTDATAFVSTATAAVACYSLSIVRAFRATFNEASSQEPSAMAKRRLSKRNRNYESAHLVTWHNTDELIQGASNNDQQQHGRKVGNKCAPKAKPRQFKLQQSHEQQLNCKLSASSNNSSRTRLSSHRPRSLPRPCLQLRLFANCCINQVEKATQSRGEAGGGVAQNGV